MFNLDLIGLEMPKVRVTALVMFTLQIKKSLELKRSKSGDSYEEWSICQSVLRSATTILRPATKPFLRTSLAARNQHLPARSPHLAARNRSLPVRNTPQKSAQNPLANSTTCGPQPPSYGPQ